jgi:hypothetical protein
MMTKQEAEQMAQETGWFETPRVKLAHGHAGYGWYAYDEECPEEGSVILAIEEEPTT